MTFTEKSHAFIAATYYRLLNEQFGERGVSAFAHASAYYGEQRGRRMAQRCIRDGNPLTAVNYYRYGEWQPTKEMIASEQSNKSSYLSYSPDALSKIVRCPWALQFHEMGLNEKGGALYCSIIDAAIVRGFNPALEFITEQTLQTESFCIQRMKNACLDPENMPVKNPENMHSFGFHCAHMYHTYRDICESIFAQEGTALSEQVLRLYAETYGEEDAAYIARYADADFSRCDAVEL